MNTYNLTKGSILKNLIQFSLPYLLSCFLQTFYGLADLFITGRFNGAATITAVSVGSQVTHMLTVIIVGLAMGATVSISRSVGEKKKNQVVKIIGNTVILFSIFAVLLTFILIFNVNGILTLLSVPKTAFLETKNYVTICFIGIIFITAYNVLSSIYRGLGDTKHPMYFVMISGIINIALDYLFIGPMGMKASGAALATVIAQAISVILALLYMPKTINFSFTPSAFRLDQRIVKQILRIGIPIGAQDGLIQISFLIITTIANRRGVDIAAAVGIVEKIIGFLFLVPSAMLSAVSTICAQNIGAKQYDRSTKTLFTAMKISVGFGIFFTVICQFCGNSILPLFTKNNPAVIYYGVQYLRIYVFDCIFAGVHFCFSGYFCACEKPFISFIHNIASIALIRIPVAYFGSVLWPETMYPMGLASPLGSALSVVICIVAYKIIHKKMKLSIAET
ncbi:MAG: MATE family efflux transporter [Anaerostipes sp.]|nr:MATE family efflux transporter [Anaerostipes sp.]